MKTTQLCSLRSLTETKIERIVSRGAEC